MSDNEIRRILHSMPPHFNKSVASDFLWDMKSFENKCLVSVEPYCTRMKLDYDRTLDLMLVLDYFGDLYQDECNATIKYLKTLTSSERSNVTLNEKLKNMNM